MGDINDIKKKIQLELKLNGYILKTDFVVFIVKTLIQNGFELSDRTVYDKCMKQLCESFEKDTECERSIGREQVEKAIEYCLHSGFVESEIIFHVISAFEFPKLEYNLEKKIFSLSTKKSSILSDADSRAELFNNRYKSIKHRVQKAFHQKNMFLEEKEKTVLQTVDFLLTVSHKELNRNLILGAILQGSNGKYFLEDPTGIVELDLKHTEYHSGFYCEGCFVLVNGLYEDKILSVSSMFLPPGEDYKESKMSFGNINYFGGRSETPMRHSEKLEMRMRQNENAMIVFISDLWLDKHIVFEKLEEIFGGYNDMPPIAFVFIGNFLSISYGTDTLVLMRKYFKQLAELINRYDNILQHSQFVFVPGLNDPCISYIVPKAPLPSMISTDFKRLVPKSTFTSNPCRIQYCTREIVIYKSELVCKFVQESLHKPPREKVNDYLIRTLVSQGHLSPFSLNVQPVHWNMDYMLQIYPLPDLIVIGDKTTPYLDKYKNCWVTNPGCFIESGFSFKCYTPATNTIDECSL